MAVFQNVSYTISDDHIDFIGQTNFFYLLVTLFAVFSAPRMFLMFALFLVLWLDSANRQTGEGPISRQL